MIEKIHGREVDVFSISAGCTSGLKDMFCQTLSNMSVSERFAKDLSSLMICQKENPIIREIFAATSFQLLLAEFNDFANRHVVEIEADGTCRLWGLQDNDFDEVSHELITNFGTSRTPCFLYQKGFFVLCKKCGQVEHCYPRVLSFTDNEALLVLGDDLLISYRLNSGRFGAMGDFIAFYQTAKSALVEVCRKDGVFELYQVGTSLVRLFEFNKSKGCWFSVSPESGDIAFCDPDNACNATGISYLLKFNEETKEYEKFF